MSKTKKVFLQILFAVFILTALAFATLIVRELYIDNQSQSFYEELAIEARRQTDEDIDADDTQTEQTGQPDTTETAWTPYIDFEALNSSFPGVVGWMILDGTPIDYPVMQYTDNNFFLTRLPDGTLHRNGSIFLDYRNKSNFSDKSILIFGHENRAGDMFGALKNYRNQNFFDENPVIYLFTPEKDYTIQLFAGHVAHSERDHPPLEFEDDEEFMTYIDHIRSISVFNSDIAVTADDRIVSLVTCTYDFNDARLIIVGILIE